MNQKQLISLCLLTLHAVSNQIFFHEAEARETVRPDMVIFLSDDHTWRDSSVYGSSDIPTPNMQRIADAGMTFDNAFVASPSCAPSRAAFLTGLYPSKNGAEPNHSRPRTDVRKLPSYLQELGYEVAAFGKVAHYRHTPEYGFDVARHFEYHDDVAIDAAVEWLEERQSSQPLCLLVGTNWPHVPWPEDVSVVDLDSIRVPPNHVDTKVSRDWRAKYVAAIRMMDDELGKVYDAARRKLGDDVFFLHSSDHGAQWPFGKWNLYDDGIRTPLIVSWPGKIAKGQRTAALVSWIDILPTLLDVAGERADPDLDGHSFRKVLEGKSTKHRDAIFTTHSGDGNHNVFPIRSIRTADGWKYIRNLYPEFRFRSHVTETEVARGYWGSWLDASIQDRAARAIVNRYQNRPAEELYDTKTDPYEQTNLVEDRNQRERLQTLRGRVDTWLTTTGDAQTVFGKPQFHAAKNKPNIITVFIDDMGWSDLSCFGGKGTTTENIDRLANEGLRFTNFYVNSPICSPSRVALTTGQYPQRHRITSYLSNRNQNRLRGIAQWLDPNAPTLARSLQRAGYATGHFGKWHMGGQRDVGNAPLIRNYGFDRSLTNFEGLGPRVLPLKDAYDGQHPQKHDLGSASLGRGSIRWEDRSRITTSFVDGALRFIDHAEVTAQPFFINIWPDDVHSPFFPPKVLRSETDESKRELYYAVLDAMDQQLGKLFDRVRDDPALRSNTLILVMSDNGHEEGAGSSYPLRGAKNWLYEGGIRSPLIVWGPSFLADEKKGMTNETSILCALDINRSLYSFAGIEPEKDVQLDGQDLLRTLLGESTAGRRKPIFWRRPPDRPGTAGQDNPDLAVRDGRWKYLVNYDGTQPQLFDLKVDRSETKNLAASKPEVVRRLDNALVQWNQQLPQDAGHPNWTSTEVLGALPAGKFVNPIGEGADPWIVRDPNQPRYLWCLSEGNRGIAIYTSSTVTSLGQKHVVWKAPAAGPYSKQIWAPELHFLDERWYIYFAASDGKNENHLTWVLKSKTRDPLGEYELYGPLATGDGEDRVTPNNWAIDMTVMKSGGKRYAIWSGWDQPNSDQQYLYIAAMESPIKLVGPRIKLCENDDFLWERIEPDSSQRGLHEGPQIFQAKGRTAVVYSCGASWLPTYKLGLLELTGDDPLNPKSWTKRPKPVFASTETAYGVGHSSFVKSMDGRQWWHIFHAKRDRQPGWRRALFAQPMRVGKRGFPIFGEPVDSGVVLEKPTGSKTQAENFSIQSYDYFGHHQFIESLPTGIGLGRIPENPVNDFRSGEKIVFSGSVPRDFVAHTMIGFLGIKQARDAGILFRTTGPSVGYDAQRGYFAGLIPRTNLVILGLTDGTKWKELARAKTSIDVNEQQKLTVEMVGEKITISHNGEPKIQHHDGTFSRGRFGLRVVNTHARFSKISIAAVSHASGANAINDRPEEARK